MIQIPIEDGFKPFLNPGTNQDTAERFHRMKRIRLSNDEYRQFSSRDLEAALIKNNNRSHNDDSNDNNNRSHNGDDDNEYTRKRKVFTPTPAATPVQMDLAFQPPANNVDGFNSSNCNNSTNTNYNRQVYMNDNASLYSETEEYMIEGYFLNDLLQRQPVGEQTTGMDPSSCFLTPEEQQNYTNQQSEFQQDHMELDFH